MHAYTHMHPCTYTYTIHTHTYSHAYKYMHACMHTHAHACTHTLTDMHTYIPTALLSIQTQGKLPPGPWTCLWKKEGCFEQCLHSNKKLDGKSGKMMDIRMKFWKQQEKLWKSGKQRIGKKNWSFQAVQLKGERLDERHCHHHWWLSLSLLLNFVEKIETSGGKTWLKNYFFHLPILRCCWKVRCCASSCIGFRGSIGVARTCHLSLEKKTWFVPFCAAYIPPLTTERLRRKGATWRPRPTLVFLSLPGQELSNVNKCFTPASNEFALPGLPPGLKKPENLSRHFPVMKNGHSVEFLEEVIIENGVEKSGKNEKPGKETTFTAPTIFQALGLCSLWTSSFYEFLVHKTKEDTTKT